MKSKFLTTTALAALSVCIAGTAFADTIIDPDGEGATRVFPPLGNGDLSTTFADDITVGYSGVAGTLEINAENNTNGITRLINVDNLAIAQQGPDEDGEVRVIGDGTAGSAGIELRGDFRLGANSDSLLRIENGGEVIHTPDPLAEVDFYRPDSIFIGSFADFREGTGSAEVVVDGDGSRLVTQGGNYNLGAFNTGEVDRTTISNGGRIDVQLTDAPEQYDLISSFYNDPDTGEFAGRFNDAYSDGLVTVGNTDFDFSGDTPTPIFGPADELLVTGDGSELNFAFSLQTNGNAAITVEDGGTIRHVEEFRASDGEAYVDLYYDGYNPFLETFGVDPQAPSSVNLINGEDISLNVSGAGSLVDVTRDINIGGFSADASVNVQDSGTITTTMDVNVSSSDNEDGSGRLTVGTGGIVNAGTINVFEGGILDGNGGFLNANVLLDGGIIAPGASPGIMNIDGDLEILDGLLQIEIAGTGAGMFDQLNVTGDLIASMGFDIEISFLDSFVPQDGDVFNFLNVDGDSSIFDTPSLINFSVNGGGFFGNNAQLDFASGSLSLINDTNLAPVPLPAGLPLLAAGLIGLGALARRKKTA